MEYSIERLTRENLKDLIPIFKSSFKRDVTIKELLAKYETQFLGHAYLGYIAYSEADRQPAAYYGVFPMEVIINGELHLIAQSGDTMTHPLHQGKGLFVKLAKQTYELCSSLGVKAVFGFPSESSYPGFVKKLMWQHHDHIENYTSWVYTIPLSALLKVRLLKFLYRGWVKFILQFYQRGNLFQSSVCKTSDQCIARGKDFWAYKLRNPDNICVRLGDTEVILKTGVALGIGDINIRPEQRFDEIFSRIKWLAFLLGTPVINFYVSPDTLLSTCLKKSLSSKQGLAIGYLNFQENFDLSKLKFTYFDFDTF